MSKETKIVDISKFSKNKPENVEPEKLSKDELLQHGLDVFNDHIKEAEGFLGITVTEEGIPSIVWAGKVDTVSALGSIEIAKQIFIEKSFYDPE
jgi:hypothetical protein